MLLPALTKARDNAKATKCLSNIKQLGSGFIFYSNDWKGRLPEHRHDRDTFAHYLSPYLGLYEGSSTFGSGRSKGAMDCPAYGYPFYDIWVAPFGSNSVLYDGPFPLSRLLQSSRVSLIADVAPGTGGYSMYISGSPESPGYWGNVDMRHGLFVNALYMDIHAKPVRIAGWATEYQEANNKGIR